jgi:hypothetical protein
MPRVAHLVGWAHGPGRRRQWRRRVLRRSAAVACAIVAAVALTASRSADPAGLERLVVAARPIAVGEIATRGSVREAWWPAHLVPADSATSLSQVLGRPFSAPMGVGEPVTRARVTGNALLSGQPADAVAVHVTVPDPGVLSLVSAGDRIDLWGPDGPVARAVVVLRVDTSVTADFGAPIGGPARGGPVVEGGGLVVSAGQEVASAILAVPEDALGRPQLELVLRHPWPEAG